MFDISKDFSFAAAHRLDGLPDGHKCGRVHGHGYLVRVRLICDRELLPPPGFVLDYGELAPFGTWLDETFDHRWLGAGPLGTEDGAVKPATDFNPTAENLAGYFRAELPTLVPAIRASPAGAAIAVEVGVSETPKTWAWAR